MCGATPPHPLYYIMSCTDTTRIIFLTCKATGYRHAAICGHAYRSFQNIIIIIIIIIISKVKEWNCFSSKATGLYSESFRLESLLGVITITRFQICRYFLRDSQQSLQHTPTPPPSSLHQSDPAPILQIPGALSRQVQQPAHKADHSPLLMSRISMGTATPSTPHMPSGRVQANFTSSCNHE